MNNYSLKLSQKGILLAAVPLLLEIALIAFLSLLIMIPLEQKVRQSADDYAINLALSCLRNDMILLHSVLDSPLKNKDYLAPDWLFKWLKEQKDRLSPDLKGKLAAADKDSAEAWALASEQPDQVQLMSRKDYRYWSGQANQHMDDLETLVKGNPGQQAYAIGYRNLLNRFFQSVSQARADLRSGKTDKAIAATAASRLAIKQAEQLINQHSVQQQAFEEKLIRSGLNFDEAKLDAVNWQFGNILVSGLLVNLATTFALVLLFGRSTQVRLSAVLENMSLLSQSKALNPALAGADELAEIDRAFSSMAQRLEAARKKERAMVDNATDIICALNDDGQFEQVNPAAEKIWGFNPSQLLKESLETIIAPEDRDNTQDAFSRLKESPLPVSFENNIVRPDGTPVSMLWSGRYSEQDGLVICVARDITQQKAIARMKQEFIAMISNDLRKPLLFHDEFLAKLLSGNLGEFNPQGKERISKVASSTKRLVGLVNDLLDMERLASGKLDLKLADVSTADLIERAIDSLSTYAEDKSIKLICRGDDLTINVDGDRLVQVLVNLVGNALKFSPKDSSITMSAERNGAAVEFRVVDEGRGIPEELRKSIFERFKQVTKTDATEKGGTGLGLSICQKIVECHGGEIGVDSEEGKGSTFWFRLPLTGSSQ